MGYRMSNVYISRRKKKFIAHALEVNKAYDSRSNTDMSRKDSILDFAMKTPPKMTAKTLDAMIKKQSLHTR